MAAAGWTRGRGEARRGVCTVERIRRCPRCTRGGGGTLSCTWQAYSRYTWALWRNSKGYRVYTGGPVHTMVTFALISYSYACADTSAIRVAPEIGRVFSSRWLRRKAFPMAFRCNRVHTGGLNQPSLETHRSTCACVRREIYIRHVHLGWL